MRLTYRFLLATCGVCAIASLSSAQQWRPYAPGYGIQLTLPGNFSMSNNTGTTFDVTESDIDTFFYFDGTTNHYLTDYNTAVLTSFSTSTFYAGVTVGILSGSGSMVSNTDHCSITSAISGLSSTIFYDLTIDISDSAHSPIKDPNVSGSVTVTITP